MSNRLLNVHRRSTQAQVSVYINNSRASASTLPSETLVLVQVRDDVYLVLLGLLLVYSPFSSCCLFSVSAAKLAFSFSSDDWTWPSCFFGLQQPVYATRYCVWFIWDFACYWARHWCISFYRAQWYHMQRVWENFSCKQFCSDTWNNFGRRGVVCF